MRRVTGATLRGIAHTLLIAGGAVVTLIFPFGSTQAGEGCNPEPLVAITVDCLTSPGTAKITVPDTQAAYAPLEFFFATGDSTGLEVFNAGVIEAVDGGALNLVAATITYHGVDTAELTAMAGTGLRAEATTGSASFVIDHNISALFGVSVNAFGTSFQRISVELGARKTIEAGVTGIAIGRSGGAGAIDLTIGAGAEIRMDDLDDGFPLAAIKVMGEAPVTIALAGKISGATQNSVLSEGDDTLELLQGFGVQGTIDATLNGTNGDTLKLSGTSTARHFVDVADITGPYLGFETLAVGPEATLTGAGALDAFERLDVSGTLAPGDFAVGSLVAEEAVFQATSILEIEIGDADTQVDQLELQRVTINGGTVRVVNTVVRQGTFSIVLLADQQAPPGIFTKVEHDFEATYSAALVYDPDAIRLVFTKRLNPDPGPDPDPDPGTDPGPDPDPGTDPVGDPDPPGGTFPRFAQSARTPEQAAVAQILDAMGESAPYADEFRAMDAAQRTAFLAQLAGSGFAATGSALLQSTATLSAASLGRIQQQSGTLGPTNAVLGYSSFTTNPDWIDSMRPSGWGRLIAGTSTVGGGSAGSVALIGGADVELGEEWTLGLLAGMGSSSFAAGNTAGKSTDLSAGFYGAKEFGDVALRFGGSLTHHSIESVRTVTAPGVVDKFTANYAALTAQVFAEAAVEFDLGAVSVELFGDVGYARNFSAGFTETGGAGALTVAGSSSDAVETLVGVRASQQVALGTKLLTAGVMLGWKHRFMAAPSTMNSLAGGAPFEVAGTSIAGSALAAGADLRLDLDERTGLEIAYALEWGATGAANTLSARYTRRF